LPDVPYLRDDDAGKSHPVEDDMRAQPQACPRNTGDVSSTDEFMNTKADFTLFHTAMAVPEMSRA
jgi:hypothetical protein